MPLVDHTWQARFYVRFEMPRVVSVRLNDQEIAFASYPNDTLPFESNASTLAFVGDILTIDIFGIDLMSPNHMTHITWNHATISNCSHPLLHTDAYNMCYYAQILSNRVQRIMMAYPPLLGNHVFSLDYDDHVVQY